MPQIEVKHVISFTSQDPKHPLKDLLAGHGPWLGVKGDSSKTLVADLQLEKATKISYIDIGNAGSVMVGVEVGRSAWPVSSPYVTLVPKLTMMTRAELTNGTNRNCVRMLTSEHMDKDARDEEWDRVRVVCVQPFIDSRQFGIAMFKLYTGQKVTPKPELIVASRTEINNPQRDKRLAAILSNKAELLAKLKRSNPEKKSEVSNRVKRMESSQLTEKGVESPVTKNRNHPLCRGAQLVTLAAKTPTKQEKAVSKSDLKAKLEKEVLAFLVPLRMTVEELDNIFVEDLIPIFERERGKPLVEPEREWFESIAVDYAMRQIHLSEKRDMANGASHVPARKAPTIEMPAKPPPQQRKAEDRRHLQELGNQNTVNRAFPMAAREAQTLDSPPKKRRIEPPLRKTASSKFFKNSTTPVPKPTPRKRPKKVTPKPSEQQSLIGKWITPENKMPKEKKGKRDFKYSSIINVSDVSDDSDSDIKTIDIEDIDDSFTHRKNSSNTQHTSLPSTSGTSGAYKGHNLGAAPRNKYNVVVRGVRESLPSHSRQEQVACPLCYESFPAQEIESHASSCGTNGHSDSDSDVGAASGSSRGQTSTNGRLEECPVCGTQIPAATLESHTTLCASRLFD